MSKLRKGFVSNSSSSSYIVMANEFPSDDEINKCKDQIAQEMEDSYDTDDRLILPNRDIGETEFGWQETVYDTFGDRLNFCAQQIVDLKHYAKEGYEIIDYSGSLPHGTAYQKYLDMLKDVCNTYLGVEIQVVEQEFCYIDHQSSAVEGCNMDMFKDNDSLVRFIFNSKSHIVGGNDNG